MLEANRRQSSIRRMNGYGMTASGAKRTSKIPCVRLLCRPAAIDGYRRARDLVCRRRAQEGDGAAKLLRRSKIQRRLLLSQKLLDGFLLTYASLRSDVADLLFNQRRSHPAGTNCVAGNAAPGGLQANHLRQADQPVLGCDVGGLVCRSDEAMRGGDVDDPSPTLLFHLR